MLPDANVYASMVDPQTNVQGLFEVGRAKTRVQFSKMAVLAFLGGFYAACGAMSAIIAGVIIEVTQSFPP